MWTSHQRTIEDRKCAAEALATCSWASTLIWIPDPYKKEIQVISKKAHTLALGDWQTLEGSTTLPRFRIKVADVFAQPTLVDRCDCRRNMRRPMNVSAVTRVRPSIFRKRRPRSARCHQAQHGYSGYSAGCVQDTCFRCTLSLAVNRTLFHVRHVSNHQSAAHHHRSGRGARKINLPDGIETIPRLFQNAGYHTSLGGWPTAKRGRFGKSDYNFEWDASIYDSNDWIDRKPGQPFFAQIQTPGAKRRGGNTESAAKFQDRCAEIFGAATPISKVTLPPYYPNDPVLLADWAAYLDCCRYTDRLIGEVVQRLKDEGELENTIILFMTDHGISHARGKQFLYDEGIHVPLVIAGPGVEPGQTRTDLVEHIDIGPLSLGLAGIEVPGYMQGRDILAESSAPVTRDAVFSARDRCDETVEHMRSVRTDRFNVHPTATFHGARSDLICNRAPYKDQEIHPGCLAGGS